MSRIFTLSGPSGVGKTTFLLELFRSADRSKLRLLPRYTDRPIRHDEEEGFEYLFTSRQGMLQKLSANDFIHIEKWGDYYSAIEKHALDETLKSSYSGIVLASTFGAARLRATPPETLGHGGYTFSSKSRKTYAVHCFSKISTARSEAVLLGAYADADTSCQPSAAR